MHALRMRRGIGAGGLVVVLIILGLILILVLQCYDSLARPGGKPLAIHVRPASSQLTPGNPMTFQVEVSLAHPLPANPTTLNVDIYEDDWWWFTDDLLLEDVEVVYNPAVPGRPYAFGTFQLECVDLQAGGEFDLEGHPTGGTSADEAEHDIYASDTADDSQPVTATCTVPTEEEEEYEGLEPPDGG